MVLAELKSGQSGDNRFPGTRILIIEARFYDHIADELVSGAIAEIEAQGATYERVVVPGALEIPQVLVSAIAAGRFDEGYEAIRASILARQQELGLLPDGVELAGFPGQREIAWQTSLVEGKNYLPLELIALSPVGGEVLARLEHDNRMRTFRLRIEVS